MADDTTDVSVTEQLSICIRYVDTNTYQIRGEFLDFVKLTELHSEQIADSIMKSLEKWGLSAQNLLGQGYDGATEMIGHVSGVQNESETVAQMQHMFTVNPIS